MQKIVNGKNCILMKATYMDHFGSSKFKVTGFLKKAFIWLDPKKASTFNDEAQLKKVAQYTYIYIWRERENDSPQNIWYSELCDL